MEIKITRGDGIEDDTFTVESGDKVAKGLGYDEMLGLVSVLGIMSLDDLPCLGWLKPKKQVYQPKNGEFVTWGSGTMVSIYHCKNDSDDSFKAYASLFGDNLFDAVSYGFPDDFRPATADEKRRLRLALASKGNKFWDATNKRMCKIDEHFNIVPL